jgi:hypothetical protein
MVVCGVDFVMEVVVFCGNVLLFFFLRKTFALQICKNSEQVTSSGLASAKVSPFNSCLILFLVLFL